MAMRGPRTAVGSAIWIADERSAALNIVNDDLETFSLRAMNEVDWLNEHMAQIFSGEQMNVTDVFKTPGKLRGKTPRTARKANAGEARVPLSNLFSSTPQTAPKPFAKLLASAKQQTPKLKIAEDKPKHQTPKPTATPAKVAIASPVPASVSRPVPTSKFAVPAADSGYHGSQDNMDVDELAMDEPTQAINPKTPATQVVDFALASQPSPDLAAHPSPTQPTIDPTFHSAKEEQTTRAQILSPVPAEEPMTSSPVLTRQSIPRKPLSPQKTSPVKQSPYKSSPVKAIVEEFEALHSEPVVPDTVEQAPHREDDEHHSASDGSSPIRGIVRKSSMNFPSLPARQPLAGRVSRVSHLDQTRQSVYNRQTGGKSIGNVQPAEEEADDDHDDMDIDDDLTVQNTVDVTQNIAAHNKTYTQRLQDQISMLGKSQSNGPRPSKSLAAQPVPSQTPYTPYSQPVYPDLETAKPTPSPQKVQSPQKEKVTATPAGSPRKEPVAATPGAFPEDDDDDWILSPEATKKLPTVTSPRPVLQKGYTVDIMEQVPSMDTVGGSAFALPKQRQQELAPSSPHRQPYSPEKPPSAHGHSKSASVPHLPNADYDMLSPKKGISVSNPTLATVPEGDKPETPKSPSRGFRDSPLKQVKNKLSSIIKSSKGLLASSAAISAEGKSSLLSPSSTRLGVHPGPSVESLAQKSVYSGESSLYPNLSPQRAPSPSRPESPTRVRKTRASTEREKREQKQKEKELKEAKEAQRMEDKLQKAREKEIEKARVFSKEQEKQQPASPVKEPPRATRSSPRKAKAQAEAAAPAVSAHADDGDIDMVDAPAAKPTPSIPRPTVPSQANRSIKRPIKPTKETQPKSRQAPTVIRVNTTSSSQLHPSNHTLANNLHDTLGSQLPQLKTKASAATLQKQPSLQSLKSSVSSSGRPKALELAAKRKEQEEREAQRKREAKAELERKRALVQQQERKAEEQRRQEAQQQREKEREQAEAKKAAQRQAALEKAKQTRAPPPAQRSQPNGPPEYGMSRNDAGPPRPPSRLQHGNGPRSQEELGRPMHAALNSAAKPAGKRPLQQDDEESSRPGLPRNGPSYQKQEVKRMRMSDEFDEDELEMGGGQRLSNIKGPPVRPSAVSKKELPGSKSIFTNTGYTPAPQGAVNLFKTTVQSQTKVTHALDTAQFSKGAIPFAPNPNGAMPSHKTPARPAGTALPSRSAAKSAAKSSPRFPNGDNIDLPEIQTDDDDSDDDGHIGVAPWADSPALRKALMQQETMDPMAVFGQPGPLNMEEVFSKSKDRWHKFRARTSSANWSGADRLTEDDIRKDLAARDKIRREGGWSYELSKDSA